MPNKKIIELKTVCDVQNSNMKISSFRFAIPFLVKQKDELPQQASDVLIWEHDGANYNPGISAGKKYQITITEIGD